MSCGVLQCSVAVGASQANAAAFATNGPPGAFNENAVPTSAGCACALDETTAASAATATTTAQSLLKTPPLSSYEPLLDATPTGDERNGNPSRAGGPGPSGTCPGSEPGHVPKRRRNAAV